MQYNLTINQFAVCKLGLDKQLDVVDLLLFDFIYHTINNPSIQKTTIDGTDYWNIRASLVIQECPILVINHRNVFMRRMNKLCDVGLLERYENNQKENTSYYKRGRLFTAFIRCDEPATEMLHPATEMLHPLQLKSGTNIIPNKHNTTTTYTRTRMEEIIADDKKRLVEWITDNEYGLEQLLKQVGLIDQATDIEKMTDIVTPYIERFYDNLQMCGREDINTTGRRDVKAHFSSWLRKIVKIDNEQIKAQPNGNISPKTNFISFEDIMRDVAKGAAYADAQQEQY